MTASTNSSRRLSLLQATLSAIALSFLLSAAPASAQDEPTPEVKDVFCWVNAPRQVTVGKPFTITVRIENLRDTPFTLRTLSLDDAYMEGNEYKSSLPADNGTWEDTDRYIELDYDHVIAAGSTVDYILTIVPFKTGIFSGYLDFEEGLPGMKVSDLGPFSSRAVQTIVVR